MTGRAIIILLSISGLGADIATRVSAEDGLHARPQDLEWFQDAKFGMFIHWGPTRPDTPESFEAGEQDTYDPGRPVANLYKGFNPTKFDAGDWVAVARSAGMKYLVFTAKHIHCHGFSMFDTKLSDYKITRSRFGRDVCAELADACHKGGMRLGWYYSPWDGVHPEYHAGNHRRCIDYLQGQLGELCTRYGKVDIIWFDGLDNTKQDWDTETAIRMIRRLQPSVLINGRAGVRGDFQTPEQRIGRYQVDRPWETCMTLGDNWFWTPGDRIKSFKACIEILVRCVGNGGNLLLNVGPGPTGEIEPRQVEQLRQIGNWLKTYGASIYGTRGGPYRPGVWGVSTHRDKMIYLHILNWNEGDIHLPAIAPKIVSSALLGGGMVTVRQTAEGVDIAVPIEFRHEPDTVVVLELDGPADQARPAPEVSGSVATRKPAVASDVRRNLEQFGPAMALDDDYTTYWITNPQTTSASLEVDLGQTMTICRATVCEVFNRVRAFELQYKLGDQWRTATSGERIGEELKVGFNPVQVRYFRLNILNATNEPMIAEFQLFSDKP